MKKKGNRLTDMEFDEVSLVTRPANQLSKVVLFKSDTPVTEEEQVNPEDQVEEVVAEEVATEEVVEKGKKKKAVPAMGDAETPEEEMADDEEDDSYLKKKKMKKSDEEVVADDDAVEIPAEVFEYIEALESANAELVDQVSKMAEQFAEIEEEANMIEEEILKSADPRLVEIVKGLEERASAAEAIAKAERDHRLEQEFIAKASSLNNLSIKAEEFGIVLKGIADNLTDEQYDAIWQVLTSANANLEKSGLFTEFGKSTTTDNSGPMSIIEKAASALRQSNPSLTREQAIAKAVEADTNLYNQYIREGK